MVSRCALRAVGCKAWGSYSRLHCFPSETLHKHTADTLSLFAASSFVFGLDLGCSFFRKTLLMDMPTLHNHLGCECPKKHPQSDFQCEFQSQLLHYE
jgi:hypothetical protein